MAKTINFQFEGETYTLEYTRASVVHMEKQGFVIGDIQDKPMIILPALFEGAFFAHHPFVKKSVIEKIFDKMTNKMDLVMRLAEMYNEPMETLVAEPEGTEGNLEWGASW